MNDVFDLVDELTHLIPPADPACTDRHRATLTEAIGAEQGAGDVRRNRAGGRRPLLARALGRRTRLVGGIAASVAAILVVTFVVVPGLSNSPSAAAAVLEEAAAAAGQFTTPGPGQFRYVETQSTEAVTVYGPGATPGQFDEVATTTFAETDQSWTDAAGNGQVLHTWGTLRFSPTSAQAVSKVMGPGYLHDLEGGRLTTGGLVRPEQPPVDVADLPTDPAQLSSVLEGGQLGTKQFITNGPDAVFERAARLLIGPTSGMTPSLASALFQVMADQPGARFLGTVTDHNGQRGEGVMLNGAGPTTGTREPSEVVVDPERGQLLEVDYASPPATTTIRGGVNCSTVNGTESCIPPKGAADLGPVWTDVVASGVVGSSTATVPATGSATITATQVPAAPTDLVVTVQNGAVDLSWEAPAPDAGPVTDYIVYLLGTTGPRSEADTHSAVTTYTWRFLPTGRSLTFAVQAVNGFGYGPLSESTTIAP